MQYIMRNASHPMVILDTCYADCEYLEENVHLTGTNQHLRNGLLLLMLYLLRCNILVVSNKLTWPPCVTVIHSMNNLKAL